MICGWLAALLAFASGLDRFHHCLDQVLGHLHPPRENHGNATLARDLLNLDRPANVHWSQIGQDSYVDSLLKQKRNGFFVEAGASDGETLSNTLFFEVSRGWTGLLVEANPFVFTQLLARGRNAYAFEGALSTSNRVSEEKFYVAGELGGLRDAISAAHKSRIDQYKLVYGRERTWTHTGYEVSVVCVPLAVILRNIGRRHVDFLSLDVEGAELPILEAVLLSKDITIDIIAVEVNDEAVRIAELMAQHNFVKVGSLGGQDDLYRNKHFVDK